MTELAIMKDQDASILNKLLTDLEASGAVKTAELAPSLNALLSDTTKGGFPGRAFLGKVTSFNVGVQMPTMNDPDKTHEVDVLELKDSTGDFNGETFAFNAGNGGLKAKLAKVRNAKTVLIVYRGEMERTKNGFNPPKDYGILEVIDEVKGAELYKKLKAQFAKK